VDFRYEVYSNELADLTHSRQSYKLQLTATVGTSDMNPAYSETQTVNLAVVNCCASDKMTVVTGISPSDYVYYINEDTEKNVWAQGTNIPKVKTWTPQWT